MNEYIKRKNLVDLVLSKLKYLGDARIMNEGDEKVLSEIDGYEKALEEVHKLILDKDLIENIQPVKHGYWEEVTDYGGWGDTYYRCSVCGEEWYLEDGKPKDNNMNFCPRCGARMDGDSE